MFGGHRYFWSIGREVRTTENLEKDRLHDVVEQNLIAARGSPGSPWDPERQATLCQLSGLALSFVCLVPPHLVTVGESHPGESATLCSRVRAPWDLLSVRDTKPETVFPFKCNFVLQERRKARKRVLVHLTIVRCGLIPL